ncbi:RNA polymerase sigma factor [Xylanimonas ulmi]|uniref:RNA polymerase sigma factor (Sigma-70 family) n=1 Tax=Xylanimonas ulmi TaxID=228973 RepID=A0A4Q7M6P6_9MICO|nr:sigma-70 family RNA polymerase sigma factor [Xylanibacterium ulmi]RZS62288.1 RNA polymerase sigma factor (sigma-70 family) [Xylanibacterium ulmi]
MGDTVLRAHISGCPALEAEGESLMLVDSGLVPVDDPPPGVALTDVELVERVRRGDDEAMGELWRRWSHAAVCMAHHITDRFEAEDLAAEAFVRILHAICAGAGPSEGFGPYLYATVRCVSMNWHRDRDRLAVIRDPVEDLAEVVGSEVALDDECADRLQVRTIFASLRPQWREVLWLTGVEGLTPRDVAPILGISPNAVSALRHRASSAFADAWQSAAADQERAAATCSRGQ